MKVEPGAEDDTGRRNEEVGDDVFHIRGSKTLADLRTVVEKYIVRPWEENKDEHEEVSSLAFTFSIILSVKELCFILKKNHCLDCDVSVSLPVSVCLSVCPYYWCFINARVMYNADGEVVSI